MSSRPQQPIAHYHVPNYPTHTPIAYYAVISLFRFVLAIFFSRVVIENRHCIPSNGRPTILLVNHSNSLTDALIIMAAVPRHMRRMLRMTAKATHFRRPTFSSWLIEKAGSVPLHRAQDYEPDTKIDNSATRQILIDALCKQGDAICIFPEGISRYHPSLAPLKTGAARIASDVLSQFKDHPGFELNLLTCSITYLHRQNFRSDVLVSFHDPIVLTPDHPQHRDLVSSDHELRKSAIVQLTSCITEKIRSGTLDSPSWELIKAANMARTLYAPFGTRLSLGTHIRLTQRFVDGFAGRGPTSTSANHTELVEELLEYQARLYRLGLKDARVANNRLMSRREIVKRLVLRIWGGLFFLTICTPGLMVWMPTFAVTGYAAHRQRRKGPAWDTYDEVMQTKMTWGLASGLATYGTLLLVCLPIFPVALVGVPVWMWLTLRWLEDLMAILRAIRSLTKMLYMHHHDEMSHLRAQRARLSELVLSFAVDVCGLPQDSSSLLNPASARSNHLSTSKYFSIRRRRKKDYNEVLRLWDLVDM